MVTKKKYNNCTFRHKNQYYVRKTIFEAVKCATKIVNYVQTKAIVHSLKILKMHPMWVTCICILYSRLDPSP